MKNKLIALLLVITIFSALLTGCADLNSPILFNAVADNEQSVAINCVDEDGNPVSGVRLQVSAGETDELYSTDENGNVAFPKTEDEYSVTVYSAPDGYNVPNEVAVLNDSNLSCTITLHKNSVVENEVSRMESEQHTYCYDKLEFSGKDFDGNKVDESVFGNAEITWIKIYYYDKANKFNYSEPDLKLTKQIYEKYKDRGLQVIVVLNSLEKKMSSSDAENLAQLTDTDFLMMPICDGLKPLSYPLDYVQNIFVNKSGEVVMPVAKESSDLLEDSAGIAKYQKYALGRFPAYAGRLDETMPGIYDEETMTKFVAILLDDKETVQEINAAVAKRLAWEKDLTKVVFNTKNIYGKECDDSMFADYKLTMINFWEPWCEPCSNEMYYLNKLYNEYKDEGFQVIGVYSSEEDAGAILGKLGISYPNIVSCDELEKFSTGYVPTTLFVDSEGNVITHSITDQTIEEYPELSEDLLQSVYMGTQSYDTWKKIITDYLGLPFESPEPAEEEVE